MARTGTVLWPPSGVRQATVYAALMNSGLTKVADDTERLSLTAPATVNGVTPIEVVLQLDTSQLYRWEGNPPVLTEFHPRLRFTPPEQLAALLEAEPTASTVLEPGTGARAYSKTIGYGIEKIAVPIGVGYPAYVVETVTDPLGAQTSTTIRISPLRGELSTTTLGSQYLVFTLARPLTVSSSQDTLVVRGSTVDTAVLSSDIFTGGQGDAGGSPAGFAPAGLGAAGNVLFSTGIGTQFRDVTLGDIAGFENAGRPAVGSSPEFTNDGWRYTPKASGVPIDSGNVNDVLYKTGASTAQFAPLTFNAVTGRLPVGKLPDPAAFPIGSVPQVIDNSGTREWRVQQPSFAVPAGDSGQFVRLGGGRNLVAGKNFFPTDGNLELFYSSTVSQFMKATATGMSFADDGGADWLHINQNASTAYVTATGGRELTLQSPTNVVLNALGGYLGMYGTGIQVGRRSARAQLLKPGEVLGVDGGGYPAGLATGAADPTVPHWRAVVTSGSGAGGSGYDFPDSGARFGSIAPPTFVWQGTTYTVRQLMKDAQHAVKLSIRPDPGAVDDDWVFFIEGHSLEVSAAASVLVTRYGGTAREYTWTNQNSIAFTGSVNVFLNHPVEQLPVPGPRGNTLQSDGSVWISAAPTGGSGPSRPASPTGLSITDVVAQTSYASAQAGNATNSPNIVLPAGFDTTNSFVYVSVGTTGGRVGDTMIPTDTLSGLSGSATLTVGEVAVSGLGVGTLRYRPNLRYLSVQYTNQSPRFLRIALVAGTTSGRGSVTYAGLADTLISNPLEDQLAVWNAAGVMVNTSGADWLNRISAAGRKVVVEKPATGSDSVFSTTTLTGAVLPADYTSYDFVVCEYTDNTTRFNAGTPVTTYTIPVGQLESNASLTDIQINGTPSRMDWTRRNRTLSAGNANTDRFLKVTLVRGQGPTGPMGQPGTGGAGGVTLATSGLPSPLGTAARGSSTFGAAFDHIHATELVDNSIHASYAISGNEQQAQDWQRRLRLRESSSYDFDRTTMTVGQSGETYGYQQPVRSLPQVGSLANNTFSYLGVVYTYRRLNQDNAGEIDLDITPIPPASFKAQCVLSLNGHRLRLADARVSDAARTEWGAGVSWFWPLQSRALIPNSGTIEVHMAEDIDTAFDRVQTEIDNIREVPDQPTSPTTKWLRGDNTWQQHPALIRRQYEAYAILNIPQVSITDRVPRTTALTALTGDHTGLGLTLSANAVRVARAGLYHVAWDLEISVPSAFRAFMNRGNTNQIGSVEEFWPYPGQTRGYKGNPGTVITTAANQTLLHQYYGLDVPAFANLVPQPPATLTVAAAASAGQYTATWTYSGRRVNTWNLEWRFSGESQWHSGIIQVNRQSQRVITVDTRTTVTQGIDVRVWGTNASGDGRWSQRTWGTGGVFSQQTAHSQTLAASGSVAIRAQEWSN